MRPIIRLFNIFSKRRKLQLIGVLLVMIVAVSIIRPENLDSLEDGLLPQRWMGKKILPIYNEAGLDMDYEWRG